MEAEYPETENKRIKEKIKILKKRILSPLDRYTNVAKLTYKK